MSAVIEAPIEMVEAVADLHLPPRADQRLQDLMDRKNNGASTPEEREQLEALVELRVCSKSPISGSVSVDACIETDLGTSPRSAGGASTESC